ncbi:MAG: HD domain-containing phosphohydrolase, partial [Candidatus Brocadiales bacterium]
MLEELRVSEGRYRTITDDVLDSSKVGVFILDKKFHVVWINKALESYFGLERDNVIGKDKRQLIRDKIHHIFEEGEKFKEVVFKTYEDNTYVENFSCHVLPGDRREERWLNHWSQPITSGLYAGGRVEHYTDVTVTKQAEEGLKQSMDKLRKVLGGTIQALAHTVETRDPYTAGHQRRVANLARAIATEMGLSAEQIDGIRMAGIIHDIGKIAVPAEILTKPGVLTKTEFDMIKAHPQVGYDILKEIEFPWPVAQIVFQHQERMDGSGYPIGLSGEEIMLEARILAVADVVEAMSSHRPYRPALGIDKALEEISQNSGTLYDANVADACVRLFTEKG